MHFSRIVAVRITSILVVAYAVTACTGGSVTAPPIGTIPTAAPTASPTPSPAPVAPASITLPLGNGAPLTLGAPNVGGLTGGSFQFPSATYPAGTTDKLTSYAAPPAGGPAPQSVKRRPFSGTPTTLIPIVTHQFSTSFPLPKFPAYIFTLPSGAPAGPYTLEVFDNGTLVDVETTSTPVGTNTIGFAGSPGLFNVVANDTYTFEVVVNSSATPLPTPSPSTTPSASPSPSITPTPNVFVTTATSTVTIPNNTQTSFPLPIVGLASGNFTGTVTVPAVSPGGTLTITTYSATPWGGAGSIAPSGKTLFYSIELLFSAQQSISPSAFGSLSLNLPSSITASTFGGIGCLEVACSSTTANFTVTSVTGMVTVPVLFSGGGGTTLPGGPGFTLVGQLFF